MSTKKELLKDLDENVSNLISICQKISKPDTVVYDDWTVKDILGHLTFWHESFARNVSDLVLEKEPNPLRGKYSDLNQRCLAEFGPLSIEEIMSRLENAHQIIQLNILNNKLQLIPYRIGSRDYSPEEHLQIVNDHIKVHTKDIEKVIYT